MHCVSAYPFDSKYASLNLITDMKKNINVILVIAAMKKVEWWYQWLQLH